MPNPLRPKLTAALIFVFAPLFVAATIPAAASSPSRARPQDAKPVADADAFGRAKRMLEAGDAAGAAAELKSVAEARKTDADAWYLLGVALGRAGDAKGARGSFEKALKLRPSDADARAALAYTLVTLGKLGDAGEEARRALALDPKLAEAHYVVGVTLYRGNKFGEAADEAEEAARLKPLLGAAAYLAGDALLALYFDESERQAILHPVARGAGDDERRAVTALREPALEPFRARMREVAARLDAAADARPSNPDAALWREQASSLRFYGRAGGEDQSVFRLSEVEARAVILSKPEPGYTEEARRNNVTGIVKLRAVLAADGRVRNIAVARGLPDGLTELCVNAARRIQFKPAVRDGHAVSQYVTLEYNFQ